jgi:hypothetical protein
VSTHLVATIEAIACRPMDKLSPEQMRVMREVAADPHAERRWLTVHEVGALNLLRSLVPDLHRNGLSRLDAESIEGILSS